MKNVLVIEPFIQEGMALFEARSDVNVTVLPSPDPDAIREAIVDAHGVTVRLAKLPEDILALAPIPTMGRPEIDRIVDTVGRALKEID